MPSNRPPVPTRRTRRGASTTGRRTPVLAASAVAAVLALTATACSSGSDDKADGPTPSTTAAHHPTTPSPGSIDDIDSKLKQLGLDPDKWKDGEWKNWNRSTWLRKAGDFINPIIKGLWKPDRMKKAKDIDKPVHHDVSGDQGVTDPEPQPVPAEGVAAPYSAHVPYAGKVLFDSPKGSMVCSGTVVKDPAHPGKSNLVWTAGHCVHAGKGGGWYKNVVFVPSYNSAGRSAAQLKHATKEQLAPKGVWWADWAQTSSQWIDDGSEVGGKAAPYDFAVLHVKPENSGGKSLEETVGGALPVDFDAPAVKSIPSLTATGYPAAPPFDGQKMYQCTDRPGRLSMSPSEPTMYRIGCTMTPGSSGGGWTTKDAHGRLALVSNTSIGPTNSTWLAGPHLGAEAKGVYDAVSKKFAGR